MIPLYFSKSIRFGVKLMAFSAADCREVVVRGAIGAPGSWFKDVEYALRWIFSKENVVAPTFQRILSIGPKCLKPRTQSL